MFLNTENTDLSYLMNRYFIKRAYSTGLFFISNLSLLIFTLNIMIRATKHSAQRTLKFQCNDGTGLSISSLQENV